MDVGCELKVWTWGVYKGLGFIWMWAWGVDSVSSLWIRLIPTRCRTLL